MMEDNYFEELMLYSSNDLPNSKYIYSHFNCQLTIKFEIFQSAFALSPDGKILATGSSRGQEICIWDLISGNLVRSWICVPEKMLRDYPHHIDSLVISSDSKTLISGSRLIQSWNLENGKKNRTFKGGGTGFFVAVSSDGHTLVTQGSGRTDMTVVWDLQQGQIIRQRSRDPYKLSCLAISPDSQAIIRGEYTDAKYKDEFLSIKVEDLKTGETLREMDNSGSIRVKHLAVSLDTQFVAGGGFDGIKIWNFGTGEKIQTIDKFKNAHFHEHLDNVTDLVFSPDGKMILSSGSDGFVQVWDVVAGKHIFTFPNLHFISSIAMSQDGRILVGFASATQTLEVWRM